MNLFGLNIETRTAFDQREATMVELRESLDDTSKKLSEANAKAEEAAAKVRQHSVSIHSGNADTVAAFSRAIDLRARTFASGVIEYQQFNGKNWAKAMRGENRSLNYLLNLKPNSMQNAREMWEMASRISDLSHNGICAVWAPGMSDGNIIGLYPCTADWLSATNEYTVNNAELNIGAHVVPADDVILIRNGYGKSMVNILRRQLEIGATAEEFTKKTFAKGGTFKAIVKQETASASLSGLDGLDDEEVANNFKDINRQFAEDNDFVYDPSASQLFQIQQSFQDLQINMSHDHVTHSVAMVTGTPQPLLFQNTNAVYKNTDDAFHVFTGMTLRPRWDAVTMELNSKYIGEAWFDKRRFHVNTDALCLDSDKSRADTFSVLINAGVMTRNEVRALYNLPPVEGGDTLSEPKSNTNPQNKNTDAQPDNA